MPLFAILHVDFDGLHPDTCTVVAAPSKLAIAQHILESPERWEAVLLNTHPEGEDSRSLWQRIQAEALTPQSLLILIEQTSLDVEFGEMLRIQRIDVQCLPTLTLQSRWSNPLLHSTEMVSSPMGTTSLLTFRPQVAEDARFLLQTEEFQGYVESLLRQDIWQYSDLQSLNLITANLSTWVLPALAVPVQICNVELRAASSEGCTGKDSYQYCHIDLQVGRWEQPLEIAIANDFQRSGEQIYECMEDQWLNVGDALRKAIERCEVWVEPGFAAAQPSKLALELTCLISYLVEQLTSTETPAVETSTIGQ